MILAAALLLANQSQAQSATGLSFINSTLESGQDLKVGAVYRFADVTTNTDALVSVDSLVNGAKLNKIDDNSNGTGYKEAFQPAIQSGNIIGSSYAVFRISFVEKGTNIAKQVPSVNATAIDIDGNNNLKEFARINTGSGSITAYLMNNPDISVIPMGSNEFQALNVLGIERNGIDTSSLANMFTTSNVNITSFTIKYGTVTTVPSSANRQFSLYMKNFTYPGSTLPVKLASFTATLNNSNTKADLKWTSATEINASHFVVERSLNGSDFNEAGIVFAAGNSSQDMHYSFADNISAFNAPVIWYRLVSVDLDGKQEYSETRIIRISQKNESVVAISAYPNPVSTELRITIPAAWQNKTVQYEIYTMSGQVVSRMQTASSSQTETINVSQLSRGMYVAKVSCEGAVSQQRIVKQ